MTKSRFLLTMAAVVLGACTDVSLSSINKTTTDTVDLQGDLCASRPQKLKSPIKILFVVDSSNSLLYNDPENIHVTGIENTIKRFRGVPNVTFGILRFGQNGASQGTVRENLQNGGKDLFSSDPLVLNPIFVRMRQPPSINQRRYLGGTDYALGLNAASEYIQEDLAASPPVDVDYKYYVEFITDGMPQSDNTSPVAGRTSILTALANLMAVYPNIHFDIFSIYQVEIIPPEFVNLLPDMAKAANGTLTQVDDPHQLDDSLGKLLTASITYAEMDVSRFLMAQDVKSVLVSNLNMKIASVNGKIDLYLDSDGDGLVDLYEIAKGYNETNADTDGDGLDDFFEDKLYPVFDPLAAQYPPLNGIDLADTDHDGLNTVQEGRIGTDPNLGDTDGDGVSDGVEFYAGSDPVIQDLNVDYDKDGVPTGFELMQHTDPHLVEPADLRKKRAYDMGSIGTPYKTGDGRWCYTFNVNNIALGESAASYAVDGVVWPHGSNRFAVHFMERPLPLTVEPKKIGVPARPRQGQTFMIFRPSVPMRDPPALVLTIHSGEFDPP